MLLKRRQEIGARVTAEEDYEQMKAELAQFTSYARAVVVALALAALLVAAAYFTVFGIMGGFMATLPALPTPPQGHRGGAVTSPGPARRLPAAPPGPDDHAAEAHGRAVRGDSLGF